jgi:thiol-disulfide isomerase/thioredoxin
MIDRMRRPLLGAALAAGWLVALIVGVAAAQDRPSAADLPREQIEAIVREYLLREPEVLYEALQELQRRQQAEAEERQRGALAANRDLLFEHPTAPVAGNPEGDVTLVEFFDYRCTYCRRVVPALQALLEEDEGLKVVNLVFVYQGTPESLPESERHRWFEMLPRPFGCMVEWHGHDNEVEGPATGNVDGRAYMTHVWTYPRSGHYWHYLHLVLVVAHRSRIIDPQLLATIRAWCF